MRIKTGAMVIVLIFSSLNLVISGESTDALLESDEAAFTDSEPVNLVTASTSKNIYGQGIAKLNNGWVVGGDLNTSAQFGNYQVIANSPYDYPEYSIRPDLFVSHVDGNGQWSWASSPDARGGIALFSALTSGPNNETYVIGTFLGELEFGAHKITSASSSKDTFIAKLNSQGNWQWAVGFETLSESGNSAAGGVSAAIFSNIMYKNFDITMFMNGVLGGLVGITAGADQMSPMDAVLIGIIAGVIIVLGVALIDKLKLDDPVGAVAVHLICGIWGTLAVGIFGAMASLDQFLIQLMGVGVVGAFSVVTSGIILLIIKYTFGLRVEAEEELKGLDLAEHGMDAYADFRLNQH